MPAGRPTKYDSQILAKARKYVKTCQNSNEMPFIEELALKLDVSDDTIVEWMKSHDEFSATVKRLKMLQKLHLKKGALEKRLHPSLAVFLLKANHGMTEDEKEKESEGDRSIKVILVGSVPKTLEEAIAAREYAEENEEKFRNATQENLEMPC